MKHSNFAGSSVAALVLVLAALAPSPGLGAAGQQPIDQRIAVLEAGQKAILKELQEIKRLLQARPIMPTPGPANAAPPNLTGPPAFDLSVAGAATKGHTDAPLVLIEFSDFQCPFCARYTRDTFSQVERDYVETGKLRYVFRHFPLEQLHPQALGAAQAAECALGQGKFWEMHTRLFANQQALGAADLLKTAQSLGLKMPAFQQCVSSQAASPVKIRQDQTEGARAGITGTPTFFLGTMTKEGKVKVARRLVGAQPYAAIKTAIDALLAAPASAK